MRLSWMFMAAALGCGETDKDSAASAATLDRTEPEVSLPEPTLRRLTRVQYDNAITALLGGGWFCLQASSRIRSQMGLQAIGSSLTTISPRGVELYEDAAFDLVQQALSNVENRAALVPCDENAEGCRDSVIADFATGHGAGRSRRRNGHLGRHRRPGTGMSLGSFDAGLNYALATVLQSPHFLFRVELGEPDLDGDGRRFTNHEMASRMSFLLWNTIPDDELMRAADAGELTQDDTLREQLDRMIENPRFEDGVRAFFTDMWTLYQLDDMTKDPTVFTHMSPDVGASAREETLLGVVENVVYEDGDYRDLFMTTRTFLDRKLASIYNVRAPAREGFAEAFLDENGHRRGVLGQVSFLALQSHAVNSSATLRGKFVREVLLCQYIPPPPSDVDTSIPEASADAVTLRERVAVHLEDDFCASCHQLVDPIGLGLEQFDGLGHYRTKESGGVIDPSGNLDGVAFSDAWGLAGAVAEHDRLPYCLTQTAMAYLLGSLHH